MAMAAIFETKSLATSDPGSLRGGDIAGGLSPRGRSLEAGAEHPPGFSKQAFYPVVICYIANWKDPPILNGKIHYFYGHFQ